MSWFPCLFSVALCGGNGLGGHCQCGTYLGLLDAKIMFLTTIYRPLPPSLLFPRLCYLGYLSVSTDGGHSLGKKSLLPCTAEGLKQVKETHLGGLLFGVLGDPHFQV